MTISIDKALELIERLRREGGIVHSITNTVAQSFTANILLACGATPSMTVAPEEIEFFTTRSNTLLINLGTLDKDRKIACRKAASVAAANNKPFVLDPAMCHISPPRLAFAREMIASGPAIMRVNAIEAKALLDTGGNFAKDICLTITGSTDQILYQGRTASIENGHLFMSKTIAIGCAQGAVMAALVAKSESPFDAALAALLWFGVAGEIAASKCSGLGEFHAAFISQLHEIPLSRIADRARNA